MNKLKYYQPMLLAFTPIDAGDDEDDGGRTGQSGQNPFPCTFEQWLDLFAEDLNGNNEFDQNDYETWMNNHGWGERIEP